MATDFLGSMFCAQNKMQSLLRVTITRQRIYFPPVTYMSQHLHRELRMLWSCPEVLKELRIWTLPVSCTLLYPVQNLYRRNLTGCLPPRKSVHGNNCLNCISNHKIAYPISHDFQPSNLPEGFFRGRLCSPSPIGVSELKPVATMETKMLCEPHKLTQQAMNVSYMMVPWDSSVI